MIHLPNGYPVWLAMRMRKSNGESFSNNPKQIIDDWKSEARGLTMIDELALVIFLVALPAAASIRFRQSLVATFAPAKRLGPRR
jgi:hypothetical protein